MAFTWDVCWHDFPIHFKKSKKYFMSRLKWYDWIPFLGMCSAAYRQVKTRGLIMLIFFIYTK